jgi:hypothetical protein
MQRGAQAEQCAGHSPRYCAADFQSTRTSPFATRRIACSALLLNDQIPGLLILIAVLHTFNNPDTRDIGSLHVQCSRMLGSITDWAQTPGTRVVPKCLFSKLQTFSHFSIDNRIFSLSGFSAISSSRPQRL